MAQLWVVGSLNVDLIVEAPRFVEQGETLRGTAFLERSGGKGGNQAVALARLGARPRLVAAVGDDDRGAAYLQRLEAEGVDVSRVGRRPGVATGVALIETAAGDNRIVVVPGANDTLAPEDVAQGLEGVEPGDVVLFQLEIPLQSVVRGVAQAQRQGATVILDPAPAVPLPPSLITVDFLTPNQTEALVCAGLPGQATEPLAGARRLVQAGCRAVVQKAGSQGSFLVSSDRVVTRPAFPASVVDTVGAGDAFNAGFGFALAQGLTPAGALGWGNAAGALSTRAAGAQAALPTLGELLALVG